jgi:hypothetical protein
MFNNQTPDKPKSSQSSIPNQPVKPAIVPNKSDKSLNESDHKTAHPNTDMPTTANANKTDQTKRPA